MLKKRSIKISLSLILFALSIVLFPSKASASHLPWQCDTLCSSYPKGTATWKPNEKDREEYGEELPFSPYAVAFKFDEGKEEWAAIGGWDNFSLQFFNGANGVITVDNLPGNYVEANTGNYDLAHGKNLLDPLKVFKFPLPDGRYKVQVLFYKDGDTWKDRDYNPTILEDIVAYLPVGTELASLYSGEKEFTVENGVASNPVNFDIVFRGKVAQSELAKAVGDALLWMIDFMEYSVATLSEWIVESLEVHDIDDMQPAWLVVRNITVTFLLLGLVIIAFANVLSIDLEQYGVQRMIPKFVMGVVFSFFSFLIVKVLLETASVLQIEFANLMDQVAGATKQMATFDIDTTKIDSSQLLGMVGAFIFLLFLGGLLLLALIYLFLVLLARSVIIQFLVVVGPIAFILGIMPFLENLNKQWWSELFKWIFMGPAVMGMLLVGSIIIGTNEGSIIVDPSTVASGNETLYFLKPMLKVATAAVAYFLAAYIPLMMGGKVMSYIDKGAKGMMKFGGKTAITGGLRAASGVTGFAGGLAEGLDPDMKSRTGRFFSRLGSATPKSYKHAASMVEQYRKRKEENIGVEAGQSLLDLTNSRYGDNKEAAFSKAVKKWEDVAAREDKDTWQRKANDKKLPNHIREAYYNQMVKAKTIEQGDLINAFNDLGEAAGVRVAMDTRKSNPQFFNKKFFDSIKDEGMMKNLEGNPLFKRDQILQKMEFKDKMDLSDKMLGSDNAWDKDALKHLSVDKEFAQKMKTKQFNALMGLNSDRRVEGLTREEVTRISTANQATVNRVKTLHNSGSIDEHQAIQLLNNVGNFGHLSDDSKINMIRHNIGGAP